VSTENATKTTISDATKTSRSEQSKSESSEDDILEAALAEEFCKTMKEFMELSGESNVDDLTKSLLQFTEDKTRSSSSNSSSTTTNASSSSGLENGLNNTLKMLYETKEQISVCGLPSLFVW